MNRKRRTGVYIIDHVALTFWYTGQLYTLQHYFWVIYEAIIENNPFVMVSFGFGIFME